MHSSLLNCSRGRMKHVPPKSHIIFQTQSRPPEYGAPRAQEACELIERHDFAGDARRAIVLAAEDWIRRDRHCGFAIVIAIHRRRDDRFVEWRSQDRHERAAFRSCRSPDKLRTSSSHSRRTCDGGGIAHQTEQVPAFRKRSSDVPTNL